MTRARAGIGTRKLVEARSEMNIAFYAPMKSPDHPIPSGDRQMARMLVSALERTGHAVEVVSRLRSYSPVPDPRAWAELTASAEREISRIARLWRDGPVPDVWFCYHPYYKAPDLIGPRLAEMFDIDYVTAESSYAAKRDKGPWMAWQDSVRTGLEKAAVNICLTERDRPGILTAVPGASIELVKPFIDTSRFARIPAKQTGPGLRLMSVAMMREGDKFDSYRFLAEALGRLPEHLDWALSVIGDGPKRAGVEALFADIPAGRINWLGAKDPAEIAELLAQGTIYVWPGNGEAYGLAYLEAQAAGLPVIAQRIAGVPEVVEDGISGLLTQPGDRDAYAGAIADLLEDEPKRKELAAKARDFVMTQRSLDRAADQIDSILKQQTRSGRNNGVKG